jgi:hypothetical protein
MSASREFRKKKAAKFGPNDAIFTEDEYREALKRFLEIYDAPDGSEEAEELEYLMTIMEWYEQDNCS